MRVRALSESEREPERKCLGLGENFYPYCSLQRNQSHPVVCSACAIMEKYTLIVTEKPDAARRIASALDKEGKTGGKRENGVPYYVAKREREIVVVPALGHLYTVAEEKRGGTRYPTFNFSWVPRNIAERKAKHVQTWIETIAKLARDADTFVDACDYDIEGSLIGYCILKYACNNKETESKRMKYSTLTKQELEQSYTHLLPHLDFALIEAGQTRHEVDWLYGINLSRALTSAAKNVSGKYTTLSTGRVQGPALKFVTAREKTIRSFVPTPYWQIKAKIRIGNDTFEAQYEKAIIETKRETNTILDKCKEKNGHIEKVEARQFQQPPPLPFDLGSLQGEAYRLFRYTPKRTASIAQHLYLDALISYPRTSSQKLPPAINYEAILKNLNRAVEYRRPTAELLAKPELKPREGQREDQAHPAIYPTGNLPEKALNSVERNVWNLIVRRFMAVFGESATIQHTKVTINVDGHRFHLKAKQVLKEGWLHLYEPYVKPEQSFLPAMNEGQTVNVARVVSEDKFTKPPPKYNSNTLRRKMERTAIGTKATRADIIQTLYNRKYVQGETIAATNLGFEVTEVLEKYCPTLVSVKFTRELEDKMDNIQTNSEKKEKILSDTIQILKPVLEQLKTNETAIGKQLSEAIKKMQPNQPVIGACPTCKTGKLVTLHSRRTGKRFIGCTNYFKGLCKTSFPLPQKGLVKPLGKNCSRCGWPVIQILTRGKRPWQLCLNPQCPSKHEREKKNEVQNM